MPYNNVYIIYNVANENYSDNLRYCQAFCNVIRYAADTRTVVYSYRKYC